MDDGAEMWYIVREKAPSDTGDIVYDKSFYLIHGRREGSHIEILDMKHYAPNGDLLDDEVTELGFKNYVDTSKLPEAGPEDVPFIFSMKAITAILSIGGLLLLWSTSPKRKKKDKKRRSGEHKIVFAASTTEIEDKSPPA